MNFHMLDGSIVDGAPVVQDNGINYDLVIVILLVVIIALLIAVICKMSKNSKKWYFENRRAIFANAKTAHQRFFHKTFFGLARPAGGQFKLLTEKLNWIWIIFHILINKLINIYKSTFVSPVSSHARALLLLQLGCALNEWNECSALFNFI